MTPTAGQRDDGTMCVAVSHGTESNGGDAPPLSRLFCGGCAHFDREAWETMNTTTDGMQQSLDAALARIAALTAENDRLAYQLRNSVTDACETDTAIRVSLRPILGDAAVDGDAKGVPPLEDVVETLVAKYQSLDRMFTHSGFLKAQEIHNQMIAERDATIAELKKVGDTLEQHHRPICPGCMIAFDWRQVRAEEVLNKNNRTVICIWCGAEVNAGCTPQEATEHQEKIDTLIARCQDHDEQCANNPLRATIAELREELALAQNALAQAH